MRNCFVASDVLLWLTMTKEPIHDEVRKYFQKIGRISGRKLFKERGSKYFSRISKMRKTHGRQKKTP